MSIKVYTQNDPRVGVWKRGERVVYPAQVITGAPFDPKNGGFTTRRLKGNPELIIVVPGAFNVPIEIKTGDYLRRDEPEPERKAVNFSKPSTDES